MSAVTDSKTVVEDLAAVCVCGKPLSHVDADPGSTEWACRVPQAAVWRKITCEEREELVRERGYYYPDKRAGGLCVHSALTDHYGQYGLPKVFTEWGTYEDEPVLRDVLHPALDLEHNPGAKDRLPCEHYVWGPL